jgi:hypothetical protein
MAELCRARVCLREHRSTQLELVSDNFKVSDTFRAVLRLKDVPPAATRPS